MIDVAELMNDSDFATSYKVIRTKSKMASGRMEVIEEKVLNFYGPVQPATTKDLEILPEGEREKAVMKFLCAPPNEIYMQKEEPGFVISDVVEYKNQRYKIIQISTWGTHGFCRAFGVRIGKEFINNIPPSPTLP